MIERVLAIYGAVTFIAVVICAIRKLIRVIRERRSFARRKKISDSEGKISYKEASKLYKESLITGLSARSALAETIYRSENDGGGK